MKAVWPIVGGAFLKSGQLRELPDPGLELPGVTATSD